jgi:3-oxoacyl-(acyl-carrier-protein) synthase
MKQNIVITGEGILCAIGQDKQGVLRSLRAQRSGIGVMKHLQSVHQELPVGEVPLSNEDMRRLLGLANAPFVNRTTLMGMLAVRQALADAHIDKAQVKKHALRLVLISGTTVAGMDITERLFCRLEESAEARQCLKYHSAGSCTRMIADYFDLFADYTTVSTACSSAANALMLGARMLADGEADIAVCGGSEALSRFHLNGFRSLMILDHERCRPFDDTRGGLNLGEGAAFVVMETEEGSRKRGVEPHAYLTGYGNACDAFHQTASSANGEGAYRAMTDALNMAGLKPADIQYVNAHGTGTANNDQSESVALKRVFGTQMPQVSSTKAFTGHTTSASGSIEAVICILALRHHFLPANLGWSHPMAEGIVPTLGKDECELHHVVCNAFGFGGNDTSLIFSVSSPTSSPSRPTSSPNSPIHTLAEIEITTEGQLAEIRDYVKPLEARRMGKLMKASLLASLKALKQAGVSQPDAIITATVHGCLEDSEQLLLQLTNEGETTVSPTRFMQSTHNTIGSHIAIRLGCHGYNITYSQDDDSMRWAMHDAEQLLRSGRCQTVLVGCHNETTPLFRRMMQHLGYGDVPTIYAKAIVMSCGR